ncbi:conserved hypothetical protein [Verticillium alfalfae VaMs.102]|uniref:Uncharacterized protein n=1 Tax=Verticillium alfalfae (strain VaMs.102 / ATCC MYA-4576 / FGSC 10136) TaxID=526221 RepID=C9SQ80_VERA1|nr:conserved hypothetical protein [Verticillium alfalfae VaMs.102]EEY21005.1 conserved hypothetical protein [Verticillium alfalfae VaMs.102]
MPPSLRTRTRPWADHTTILSLTLSRKHSFAPAISWARSISGELPTPPRVSFRYRPTLGPCSCSVLRRGAGHSAGRTSWTAKAERNDYMSFIGFMVHYIHFLDPYRPAPDASSPPTSSPAPDLSSRDERDQPILLAAGYSYGAMVTSQLPPLSQILSRFAAPPAISAAADIRLRAEHLAAQQNSFLAEARASRNGHDADAARRCAVGGDEGDQRRSGEAPPAARAPSASPAGDVNWIEDAGEAAEAKLATCPTLAVFGDRDGFVAIGKLRAWGARLEARPGSKFRGVEVTGAGHTWQEEGTLSALVGAVDEFARGLLKAA